MIRGRSKIRVIIPIIAILALSAGWFCNRQLVRKRHDRERHFISIHLLATQVLTDGEQDGPKNYEELLKPYGDSDDALGQPFVDGLVYLPQEAEFILEEPIAHMISLFRSDRLVSSAQKWPRWESSGELARKFPEQEVPPPGYE